MRLGIGLGLGFPRFAGGGGAPAPEPSIATPTLIADTSPTGSNRPRFDIDANAIYPDGLYFNDTVLFRWGTSVPLMEAMTPVESVFTEAWILDDMDPCLEMVDAIQLSSVAVGTTFYYQIKAVGGDHRGDIPALESGWSNVLTFTKVTQTASPYRWSDGDKNERIVLSNGDLTTTGEGFGYGYQGIRANRPVLATSGTVSFEATVNISGGFGIGFVADAMTNFGQNHRAGKNDSLGIAAIIFSGGYEIYHSGATQQTFYGGLPGWGVGSKIRATINLANDTVTFFVAVDGVTFSQVGATVSGVSVAGTWPYAIHDNADQITANFFGLLQ